MSRKIYYLLSALTGVLLWAGWPAHGFPILLLMAFCPLLVVDYYLSQPAGKTKPMAIFFGYAYLSMVIWNTLTTWWVCNSTYAGGIIAIICNSFFMAIILTLFHITKRKTGNLTGYASLPIYWLAFEYIHLNWQLSWPWLTLGFGFSNYTCLLQWYKITGPLGGTLWIWLCNIALFQLIKIKWLEKDVPDSIPVKMSFAAIGLVVLPVTVSLFLYCGYSGDSKGRPIEIVVVQPNIDPYNEKFSGDYQEQINKMFALADEQIDSTTAYLIFPETALTDSEMWENNLADNPSIQLVRKYLRKHPHLSLITGAETYRAYLHGEKPPESARKFDSGNGYYDAYNTALQLDSSKNVLIYHKSKLVPGVEFMPFAKYLAPLGRLAFDLGGTSGTLGTQKEPTVFYSSYSHTVIAPAVCYESIYGAYIGKYIQKGAQLIVVITNDGWWKDTPGYKQHLCYGAMLAAETGKYVVQCANTGLSAIIDSRGVILQKTSWWKPAVIKAFINPTDGITFYSLHGDYLGAYACILSILLFCYIIIYSIIAGKALEKN